MYERKHTIPAVGFILKNIGRQTSHPNLPFKGKGFVWFLNGVRNTSRPSHFDGAQYMASKGRGLFLLALLENNVGFILKNIGRKTSHPSLPFKGKELVFVLMRAGQICLGVWKMWTYSGLPTSRGLSTSLQRKGATFIEFAFL